MKNKLEEMRALLDQSEGEMKVELQMKLDGQDDCLVPLLNQDVCLFT